MWAAKLIEIDVEKVDPKRLGDVRFFVYFYFI